MLLLAVAIIDWRTMRIPDPLNLAILAAGVAFVVILHRSWIDAVIGAALGYLALAGVAHFYERVRGLEGLGLGDAKLMGAAGAWIGWQGLPFALLIGASAGLAFVAARALLRRSLSATEAIPFGPFLAAGIFTVFVAQTCA
jgi:leader peptidase (prepilin peptidase)/N-methyltransferase